MPKNCYTQKQRQIMSVVCKGQSDSDEFVPVDFNWLLSHLSYRTTKESMQFSLRRLIMHNYITVDYEERGNPPHYRMRKIIYPTELGKEMLKRMES